VIEIPKHLRLDRIRNSVQPIFNLACLFTDGIQGAWVVGCSGGSGAAKGVLVAKVIACGATNMRHGSGALVVRGSTRSIDDDGVEGRGSATSVQTKEGARMQLTWK
jgi:hypothetical protein